MTYEIRVPAEDWPKVIAGLRSYEDDIRAHRVEPGIYNLTNADGSAEVIDVPDPNDDDTMQ